jgi:O-antigen/teichoic acid export membrane protein
MRLEPSKRVPKALTRRLPTGRLARNSGWALGGAGLITLALFAETIILARYLGPGQLGVFLLAIAYPEAVQQLLDFRVRDAMTKYLAEFLAQKRHSEAVSLVKLLWIIDVAVSAVAMLIVVVTAGIVAEMLVPESGATELMRIYAIGVFLASLDSASGTVLRVLDRFGLAFGAGVSASAGRLGLVAGVVALGGSLEGLVWARVGGELLVTLFVGVASLSVLYPLLWRERAAPISLLGDRAREIRNFLLNTNFTGVLRMASTKLDTLLVGVLASPSTVGIYRIGLQFGKAPLLVSDALHLAVFPALARDFAHGNIRRMRETARRASLYVAALAFPATLIVGLKGDTLIGALAGRSFRAADTTLLLCLAGVVPYVIIFWLSPLLLTTGHTGTLVKITGVATVIQLVSIVALVPPLGAAGAAVGFGLNYILTVGLGIGFVYRAKLLRADN